MTQEKLKQRLIEIIQTATVEKKYCTSEGIPIVTTKKQIVDDGEISPLATNLIASGVTIRERGEWVKYPHSYECSLCGNGLSVDYAEYYDAAEVLDLKFCPFCGADLTGVTKTEKGGAE